MQKETRSRVAATAEFVLQACNLYSYLKKLTASSLMDEASVEFSK